MKAWQFKTGKNGSSFVAERTARDCGLVAAHVARKKNVALAGLFAPTRCNVKMAEARQLAMYLCHVTLELSMTEVGRYFGRDRTTVSHACTLMEDVRDDSDVELEIAALEAEIDLDRSHLGAVPDAPFSRAQLHHG